MLKDIKYTGITTATSGYDATAGQLAVAHNVVNEYGYLEPLTPSDMVLEYNDDSALVGYKCVFKHEMLSGTVNYIFYKPGGTKGSLKFITVGGSSSAVEVDWQTPTTSAHGSIATESNLFQVTAVGNTLCVLTAVGIDYLVWKNNSYTELGTTIPCINMQFSLRETEFMSDLTTLSSTYAGSGEVDVDEDHQSELTEEIMAVVNRTVGNATDNGYVGDPFFVRYALRLFDGTLSHHSAPVLMYASNPNVVEPYVGMCLAEGQQYNYGRFMVYHIASELYTQKLSGDLTGWEDIVTGIEIYITKPASRLIQGKKIEKLKLGYSSADTTCLEGHEYSWYNGTNYAIRNLLDVHNTDNPHVTLYRNCAVLPTVHMEPELDSVFYKVKSISLDELADYVGSPVQISLADKLSVIEQQETMTDDYQTHDILMPKGSYLYNQRLNLFGVTRQVVFDQLPSAFMELMTADNYSGSTPATTGSQDFHMYVRIDVDGESKWIGSSAETLFNAAVTSLRYIYYPDVHAKQIILINTSSNVKYTMTLKEHPGLNGAYWYDGGNTPTAYTGNQPTISDVIFSELSKVYTSEVGNPFMFPLAGVNTIGTGRILALASNVRAISQGQFGEYPLYVFTETGIWMLQTSEEGLYKAKQPMSLDRIREGSQVTPVDTAVAYFTSRGLMLVSGSETKCISEVLDGTMEDMPTILDGTTLTTQWQTFMATGMCAYDSTHNRLYVYNTTDTHHYVYSFRTGLWTTEDNVVPASSVVSGRYVNTASGLYDVESVPETLAARQQTILTRPINFGTDAYKRVRDNIQRGDIGILAGETATISVLLQGSDDLIHWHDIAAVQHHYRMLRRSGTPHKWFRFKMVITSKPKVYQLVGLTADVIVTANNRLR